MKRALLLVIAWQAWAQEAGSGFALRGTVSGEAVYSNQLPPGTSTAAGFRSVFYPVWKLSRRWSFSGSIQIHSEPYFYQEFDEGYSLKADILQANVTYSQIRKGKSLTVRAGKLSSAFGSFLPRYEDTVNPLIDIPLAYGYYGTGVTTAGLVGAQVDATVGRLDMRAQFVNSSPANPRGVFDRDQYGNWTGGIGYTVAQGFRLGVSAYRGPYLDRGSEYYKPGEAKPRDLPATGYALELQWGRGPWNAYGELQRFQFAYRVIPTFGELTGYGELKRTLTPRWYAAVRWSYQQSQYVRWLDVYECAIGFRPGRNQLVKVGYEIQQGSNIHGPLPKTLAVQFVTTLWPVSISRD